MVFFLVLLAMVLEYQATVTSNASVTLFAFQQILLTHMECTPVSMTIRLPLDELFSSSRGKRTFDHLPRCGMVFIPLATESEMTLQLPRDLGSIYTQLELGCEANENVELGVIHDDFAIFPTATRYYYFTTSCIINVF